MTTQQSIATSAPPSRLLTVDVCPYHWYYPPPGIGAPVDGMTVDYVASKPLTDTATHASIGQAFSTAWNDVRCSGPNIVGTSARLEAFTNQTIALLGEKLGATVYVWSPEEFAQLDSQMSARARGAFERSGQLHTDRYPSDDLSGQGETGDSTQIGYRAVSRCGTKNELASALLQIPENLHPNHWTQKDAVKSALKIQAACPSHYIHRPRFDVIVWDRADDHNAGLSDVNSGGLSKSHVLEGRMVQTNNGSTVMWNEETSGAGPETPNLVHDHNAGGGSNSTGHHGEYASGLEWSSKDELDELMHEHWLSRSGDK
jgi:hypothetical protein